MVAPVTAAPLKGGDKPNVAPRTEVKSSLTDSVRRVERQTGGEVLSAEPIRRDGRQVNRVKVLTNDGRVRVMQVDTPQKNDKEAPPANRDLKNSATKDGGDPIQL